MTWANKTHAIAVTSAAPWLRKIYLHWPRFGFCNHERYWGTFERLSDMVHEEIQESPGTTWLYKAYRSLPPNHADEWTSQDAELLYVGISENPLSRFAAHERSPLSPWTDLTNWVSLDLFATRADAECEEKRLIEEFAPGANVACQSSFGVWADQKRIPWVCGLCNEQDGPGTGWQASDLFLAVIFGDQQPDDGRLLVRFAVAHDECLSDYQSRGIWPKPVLAIPLWNYRTVEELALLLRRVEQIPRHQRNSHRADVPDTITWDELVDRAVRGVRTARAVDGLSGGVLYKLQTKVPNLDSLLPRIGVA